MLEYLRDEAWILQALTEFPFEPSVGLRMNGANEYPEPPVEITMLPDYANAGEDSPHDQGGDGSYHT